MTQLPELLVDLVEEWRGLGCPVDELYAHGLTDQRVGEALADVTSQPSLEAVEWYTWRNGLLPSAGWPSAAPLDFYVLPIGRALAERRNRLVQASELSARFSKSGDDVASDYFWEPTWLPIGGDGVGGHMAINLASGEETSSVWKVHWDDAEARQLVADSLAEAIEFCLEVLRSGLYTWDPEGRAWTVDFPSVPLEWRLRGLL